MLTVLRKIVALLVLFPGLLFMSAICIVSMMLAVGEWSMEELFGEVPDDYGPEHLGH